MCRPPWHSLIRSVKTQLGKIVRGISPAATLERQRRWHRGSAASWWFGEHQVFLHLCINLVRRRRDLPGCSTKHESSDHTTMYFIHWCTIAHLSLYAYSHMCFSLQISFRFPLCLITRQCVLILNTSWGRRPHSSCTLSLFNMELSAWETSIRMCPLSC